MPRKCLTCFHPSRTEIDQMITDRVPYLRIATKFGLNERSVNTHGKNHVIPFIEAIEREAHEAVKAKIMAYRDQVNLPLHEKVRYIEDKLWEEYEAAETTFARVQVAREIRGFIIEQAKLTGSYVQDKQNPANVAAEVAQALKEQHGWSEEEVNTYLSNKYPAQNITDSIN